MRPETTILLSAAFVLTPKENWTKDGFARTSPRGRFIGMECPNASCWCVEGALHLAGKALGLGPHVTSAAWAYLEAATNHSPAAFNDTHTHAEVLAALYKAAALAESA